MIYLSRIGKIALSTLRVAFLSFGGGNAAMGIVQREFVQRYHLVDEKEFLQILSLTNLFPGPVITNMVSILGYRSAGVLGSFVAYILCLFPGPILVVLFVAILHSYIPKIVLLKLSLGIMPVVVAILLEFIIRTYQKQKNVISQKSLYFFIFFCTLVLLILGFNIALIFILMITFLLVLGYFQKN